MNVIIANRQKDAFADLNIDVSKRLDGEFEVDEIIKTFSNFFYNKMFLDITAIKDYSNLKNIQKLSIGLDMNKVILFLDKNDIDINSNNYLSKLVSMGIYNFTSDEVNLMYLYNNPNSYKDVAYMQNLDNTIIIDDSLDNNEVINNKRIIGFKNVTDNAGATSLIYMLKKILEKYYNVCAIEVRKRDYVFLNDKDMFSVEENNLASMISSCSNKFDLILVDLNNISGEDICSNIIYLMEPSTIRLNKMVMLDRNILTKLQNKNVVLNKSLLNENDLKVFKRESNLDLFYNIPPLDDKKDNSNILLPFLAKLNLVKIENNYENNNENKIFGLFKM